MAILLIHSPVTIVAGRLLQGFCTGLYTAFVPLYINEITTPDLAKLGTLNQIGIAFCQAFTYLLYFILSKLTDSQLTQWFWVSEYILILIAFQSFIFLKVFPFETPRYLYDHNRIQEAEELISLIYHEDHVEEGKDRFRAREKPSIVSE